MSTSRSNTLHDILTKSYGVFDDNLAHAISSLGEATASIANILSCYVQHTYTGTKNNSGDDQLHLDITCNDAVFFAVRKSGLFNMAASEETPREISIGENAYFSLGFDPLDGSSIIDANFSVGSIYGIWPGKGVLKRCGREQVASAVALYGPRTTLCIALPSYSTTSGKDIVLEVTLVEKGSIWKISREKITIQSKGSNFAPGNLRASNENERYAALIRHWISQRYTLRYTGGMVPDVYHMLIKSEGIFSNVSSDKARAKLRLVYEVAPIGLIVECAGGSTTHESYDGSVLDVVIRDLDQRLGVCFGGLDEVETFKKFMWKEKFLLRDD